MPSAAAEVAACRAVHGSGGDMIGHRVSWPLRHVMAAVSTRQSQRALRAQGLLGVFQKLIASKVHDHEGFFILNSVVEFLPEPAFRQYLPTVGPLSHPIPCLQPELCADATAC